MNDELQGKHHVMLGEMTNMYGNIFETKNVEEIEYEYRTINETVLNRIDYNTDFWNSFYKTLKN